VRMTSLLTFVTSRPITPAAEPEPTTSSFSNSADPACLR
jgi:hypothetical protein